MSHLSEGLVKFDNLVDNINEFSVLSFKFMPAEDFFLKHEKKIRPQIFFFFQAYFTIGRLRNHLEGKHGLKKFGHESDLALDKIPKSEVKVLFNVLIKTCLVRSQNSNNIYAVGIVYSKCLLQ